MIVIKTFSLSFFFLHGSVDIEFNKAWFRYYTDQFLNFVIGSLQQPAAIVFNSYPKGREFMWYHGFEVFLGILFSWMPPLPKFMLLLTTKTNVPFPAPAQVSPIFKIGITQSYMTDVDFVTVVAWM